MLYDKKWDQQIRSDPFGLDSLIAWLKTQPSNGSYHYECNGFCLLSQYFLAAGFKSVVMFTHCFWHSGLKSPRPTAGPPYEVGDLILLPKYFNAVALGTPRAYGDALKRALRFNARAKMAR